MTKRLARAWMGYGVYFLIMMTMGVGASYLWTNKGQLVQLWHRAYEQRFLIMSGEAGPVTYLVYHKDYAQLERFTLANEDVLGVEPYEFPDIAAMAYVNKDAASIAATAALPVVTRMQRKQVPMLCH